MKTKSSILVALALLLGGSAMAADQHTRARRAVRRSPEAREKLKEKYDANEDGKLGPRERAQAHKDHHARIKARREAVKDKYDEDGDGKLSAEERKNAGEALKKFHHRKHFQAWKKKHPKLWAKVLKKYDTDGDGKLAEGERKALVEAIKERREERKEKFEERKEKRKERREARKGTGGGDDADF